MSTNWDWGIFQCPQDWIGVKIYVHIYGYIILSDTYKNQKNRAFRSSVITGIMYPIGWTNLKVHSQKSDR